MLKVVSFDVVGTLVDFHYEDYVWKEVIPRLLAKRRGIAFEEAKSYVLREYDRVGITSVRWYLPEYWFKRFSLEEDPMEVFRSHSDKVRFYSEVSSILENLSQKYDLIIVSGTTRDIAKIMMEKFSHCFKHFFSAVSDRREIKKIPQFYGMICKTLEIKPSAMVHVGDEWFSDFISPRKIGIKSVFLDRSGKKRGKFVIKDLKGLQSQLEVFNSISDFFFLPIKTLRNT